MKCILKISRQNNYNCASFFVIRYLTFQLVSTDQLLVKVRGMFQLHITKKFWHLHLLIKQSRCLKAYGFSILWLFSASKSNWWKKQNSKRNYWSEVNSFHLIMRSFINFWRIKWHLWAKFIEKLEKDHKLPSCVFKLFLVECYSKISVSGSEPEGA